MTSPTTATKTEGMKDFEFKRTKIKVIGIGDGGSAIVLDLAKELKRVDFAIINTDWRKSKNPASRRARKIKVLNFGSGQGAGGNPELAAQAFLSQREKALKILKGVDLCFIISSLGGGTGSGVAPILAKFCQKQGALAFGIFTLPFKFEGEKRAQLAQKSLEKARACLNAVLVFPNENFFQSFNKETTFNEGFARVNRFLTQGLQGLIELIFQPGLINIDFADFKTILQGRGRQAFFVNVEFDRGLKIEEIKKKVFQNVFLSYGFRQAKAVLFNIVSDDKLLLSEVSEISQLVFSQAAPGAKIIFGITVQKSFSKSKKIKVVLLAIGGREKNLKTKDKKRFGKNPGELGAEIKIRRNALQIHEETKIQEEKILASESFLEIPTILRKGLLQI